LNIWFGAVWFDLVRRIAEWGDGEEKLYVFRRRGCQRFSRVLGAVRKPFELNSCAVSNTPFYAVEVAN
jgi:hypothetical protein